MLKSIKWIQRNNLLTLIIETEQGAANVHPTHKKPEAIIEPNWVFAALITMNEKNSIIIPKVAA